MRAYALLLATMASLILCVSGCSDKNEEFVFTGPNIGGGGPAPSMVSREQEAVWTAFTQDSAARMIGMTVELSPLITPVVPVAPQGVLAQSSIVGPARVPGAVIPLDGDFQLRSSQLAGDKIRIEIFKGVKRIAVADLLPSVQTAAGYEQTVILGPERSTTVENITGGKISTTVYEQLFFGYTGTALLKYDLLGKLISVEYKDVVVPGTTFATTPNYKQFEPINGVLTRNGDEMNGELSYGDEGSFTIRELIDETESHQSLLMASELFGGQGRAFLNANFDASGVYSPIPDPALSSPLVNVVLPPIETPPPLDVTVTSPVAVNYVVDDGIFQATLPSGKIQGGNIYALETFDGLTIGVIVPIPADAELHVFASPDGSLVAGDRAQLYVYATDSQGNAVPFSVDTIFVSSGSSNVVRVINPNGNQVEAVTEGTSVIVVRDTASGKSTSLLMTVRGDVTEVLGFAYLADFENQRIIRYNFNSQTGTPGAEEEFLTGHTPFKLLVSADGTRLIAENTDGVQVFAIDPNTGDLAEFTDQPLALRGLSQSQLDPDLYYGNLDNAIVELELDDTNGFTVTETLANVSSGSLATALVDGNQYVYGASLNSIYSIDVTNAILREVTMESNAFVTELATTRLDATGPQYLELIVGFNDGGDFSSILRSFPLNDDGTLNTPASQQIGIDDSARGLVVAGDLAYNGSFTATAVNGVRIAAGALSHAPGQPYAAAGAPTALVITGINNDVLLSASSANLEVFRINDDGSLESAGSIDIDGNITDVEAITL